MAVQYIVQYGMGLRRDDDDDDILLSVVRKQTFVPFMAYS